MDFCNQVAYSNLSSNSSLNKSFILDKDFSDFSFNSLGCDIERLMDSSGSGKILPEKRRFFAKTLLTEISCFLSKIILTFLKEIVGHLFFFLVRKIEYIVEITILFLIRKSRKQPPEIFKDVSKIVSIVWAEFWSEKHLTSA